jgi:predicted MFS family arabinose efflux permease
MGQEIKVTADPEKASVQHLETLDHLDNGEDDRAPEARGRNADQFEKDYWRSWRFIGSMLAIGLGFCGGTGGFALIAPVLPQINEELGPSPNITWLGLGYLVGEAVFFLLVGRLSDVFGRRWLV